MTALDDKIRQINGPINIVRMEGIVDGVRKVIYIMMDHHTPVYMQTECDNIFSRDINNYLAETFRNLNGSDRMYDFFLETSPTICKILSMDLHIIRKLILGSTTLMRLASYSENFLILIQSEGRVNISKSITNVRLHYIDPRVYIDSDFFSHIENATWDAKEMRSNLNINFNILTSIINTINFTKEKYKFILDIVKSYNASNASNASNEPTKTDLAKEKKISLIKFKAKPKNKPENKSENKSENKDQAQQMPPLTDQQKQEIKFANINYLINKIFNAYTNQNVRNKMIKRIEIVVGNLQTLISDCNDMVTSFTKIGDIVFATQDKLIRDDAYVSKFNYGLSSLVINDMVSHIWRNIIIHFDKLSNCFSKFTDVYFLRRFLDKKYITNGIVYTGSYHSWNYIEILAKQFDFKITHFAYSSIPNIELNRKIREMVRCLEEYFFIPISQCSEMTHFPDKFL